MNIPLGTPEKRLMQGDIVNHLTKNTIRILAFALVAIAFGAMPASGQTRNPQPTPDRSPLAQTAPHQPEVKAQSDRTQISSTSIAANQSAAIQLRVFETSGPMTGKTGEPAPADAESSAPPLAGAGPTAHCFCRLAKYQGGSLSTLNNYILDFGEIATYNGLVPTNTTNQANCGYLCNAKGSSWLNVQGQMCHAFLNSGGKDLAYYSHVGAKNWTAGSQTQASAHGYPQTCFGPTGYAFPSYYILSLIYAPPGCTPSTSATGYQCTTPSFVSYGSSSTTGTTTSTQNSFGANETLTASGGAVDLGAGFGLTKTSGSSVTVEKGLSTTIQWPNPGPVSGDGIDHDFDIFVVLLNPAVAINTWTDSVTGNNYAKWAMGITGPAAKTQDVQVSYLRCALAGRGPNPGGPFNPALYDPSSSCLTNSNLQMPQPASVFLPGLTNSDYVAMLNQDLFWNASPAHPVPIPAPRFTQQGADLPYDPPMGQGGNQCTSNGMTNSLSNSNTSSTSTETNYQASFSFSGGIPHKFNLKSTTELTWTNTTSSDTTTANSQSATALVTCASKNWPGPDDVAVYYDNIFGTFLFVLDDGSDPLEVHRLQGTIVDPTGNAVPGEPLTLTVGSNTYHTFTHFDGGFTFHSLTSEHGPFPVSGTLSVGGVTQTVALGPQATAKIAIPQPPPSLYVFLQPRLSRGTGGSTLNPTNIGNDNTTARVAAANPLTDTIWLNVTNLSGSTTAMNVTVTGILGVASDGTNLVATPLGAQSTVPFAVPGAASLKPGSTVPLPLLMSFKAPSGAPAKAVSIQIQVKADNAQPITARVNLLP